MLDPLVASFAEPLALYLYWRLRRYGGLEQPIQGSLPSTRGGALAGARLEHVPRRGTLVVQAVFPPRT